jgi:oxygen-independent coproporphyrinogen III oxidase
VDRQLSSGRAEFLSAHVPRYTSYPTAPHFHGGIDAGTYRAWLEELTDRQNLSLYVHIPFCDSLCWFCGCHTRVVHNYAPIASYLDVLFAEIDAVAPLLAGGRRVSHIHWGGGSPTLLGPVGVARLAERLSSRFRFEPGAEFAVEIDPRELSDETILALAAAGVNRASLGVQDCDETVQRAINRWQPFEVTRSAAERLRSAGINRLNVDIMYGLPHQTVRHVERTIDMVLTLKPDRVAVFGYAHVPDFKRHQRLIPVAALPDLGERLRQYDAAQSLLTANGYVAIGLDHFARAADPLAVASAQGTLRRNFQGYTTDTADALIGLGASSIGSLPQGYVQNWPDIPAYRKAVAGGALPVARGVALSDEDRVRRAVIERLMCDLGVDLDAITAKFGLPPDYFAAELTSLQPLAKQRIVEISANRLRIDPEMRAAVRLVCAAFDKYLAANNTQHAIAV